MARGFKQTRKELVLSVIQNIQQEKNIINTIIANGIKEIIKIGVYLDEENQKNILTDIDNLMRALQLKNKIYDYAVLFDHELSTGHFIKIAYSLINSTDNKYQDILEFRI